MCLKGIRGIVGESVAMWLPPSNNTRHTYIQILIFQWTRPRRSRLAVVINCPFVFVCRSFVKGTFHEINTREKRTYARLTRISFLYPVSTFNSVSRLYLIKCQKITRIWGSREKLSNRRTFSKNSRALARCKSRWEQITNKDKSPKVWLSPRTGPSYNRKI